MSLETDAELPLRTVRISNRSAPAGAASLALPKRLATPLCWLGAKSPFGLALPDARPSASTLYAPRGVWLDDERLIVCDSGNHRIMIWNSIPTEDQQPADVVLSQPSFFSEGPAAGGRGPDNGVHLPTGVVVAEGRLLVADAWHHRILVWKSVPDRSDTPPDYAIGQGSLSDCEPNRGGKPSLATLYWPYGIAWIQGRLYVADTGNRRIVFWSGIPELDRPAEGWMGQDDPQAAEENRGGPVAANSFRWPHDLAGIGDQLFVVDAGNHRVLGWDHPQRCNAGADCVLGQPDFTTAFELPYDGQGPHRLRFPYAVSSWEDVLAVADTANNRVLFWRVPFERPAFASAFDVIGQEDFAANGENRWNAVEKNTLCWPYGICFHRGMLAVADSGNNRVMLWDCRPML